MSGPPQAQALWGQPGTAPLDRPCPSTGRGLGPRDHSPEALVPVRLARGTWEGLGWRAVAAAAQVLLPLLGPRPGATSPSGPSLCLAGGILAGVISDRLEKRASTCGLMLLLAAPTVSPAPPPGPLPLVPFPCARVCAHSPAVGAAQSGLWFLGTLHHFNPAQPPPPGCTRPPAHGTRPLHTAHHCFSLFLGFVSLGDTPSLPLPRRLWPILWAPAAAATPPPQAALTWPSPCRSRCLSIVPALEQGTSLCLSFLF